MAGNSLRDGQTASSKNLLGEINRNFSFVDVMLRNLCDKLLRGAFVEAAKLHQHK